MKLADGREVVTDAYVPGGRYNVYDCLGSDNAEPHSLLSMDVDDGVTPMFVACPDHGSTASSRGYRVDRRDDFLPVRMVWRRATNGELKRERREGGDHYRRGGLAREWVP